MIVSLRSYIRFMLLTLSLISGTALAGMAAVEGVRLWRAPDHTRVVLDLKGTVKHNLFMLKNPSRVVIDLADTRLDASLNTLGLNGTPISRIRSGIRRGNDLRIVLELNAPVSPRSFSLGANAQYGNRLVIDLYSDPGATATRGKAATAVHPEETANRDVIIAIDAGHGGEDPGAIGPGRVAEKNVVLAIARKLESEIERKPGFRAVLIRNGDYYVGLKRRRDLARQAQADLFVSIHADAFKIPSVHGASVYALSQRGATSASAAFLAEKENGADLIGGVRLDDKEELLAEVLTDLSMTATLDASLNVGSDVLNSMGKVTHLHKRNVEQAGFAVLKSPDIPSLLIETGFISNPGEADRLSRDSHRSQLAVAISQGVQSYFNRFPPPGTLLAAKKSNRLREHVIARGDTLSEIAERYHVTVASLRQTNRISGSRIRTGQKLLIPRS